MESGRRRSRDGGRLTNLVVLVTSGAICLLAAEVSLRVLSPSSQDPFRVQALIDSERGKFCEYHSLLGWAGRALVEDRFRVVDSHHQVHQNRYGFRGSTYPEARGTDRRLAVLGDSFVWGYGVEEDEIFTHLIEVQTRPSIEVVNLGVSGYGNDQELLLWREIGHRFQPDVVLLVITPHTDLFDNVASVRYGYPKPLLIFDAEGRVAVSNTPVPKLDPQTWITQGTGSRPAYSSLHWLGRLAARSALMSTILTTASRGVTLRHAFESRRILPPRIAGYSWEHQIYQEPSEPLIEDHWEQLIRIVQTLGSEVTTTGARFVVAIAPSVVQIYDDLWTRMTKANPLPDGKRWNRQLPNTRIAEALGQELRLVDLTPRPSSLGDRRSPPLLQLESALDRQRPSSGGPITHSRARVSADRKDTGVPRWTGRSVPARDTRPDATCGLIQKLELEPFLEGESTGTLTAEMPLHGSLGKSSFGLGSGPWAGWSKSSELPHRRRSSGQGRKTYECRLRTNPQGPTGWGRTPMG